MKSVQILVDEPTLAGFDADEQVQRHGRSAVLRRIVREYLEQRQRRAITNQYRQAYGAQAGLGPEFTGWEDQGTWPRE